MIRRTLIRPPFTIPEVRQLCERLARYRAEGYDRPEATSGERGAVSLLLAALTRAYAEAG